jgi:hypothetical protein
MSHGDTIQLAQLANALRADLRADLPAESLDAFERQFARRLEQLMAPSARSAPAEGFRDLVGLSPGGDAGFNGVEVAPIPSDFDDAVLEEQVRSAGDLYLVYQHERMRVFDVADSLLRLFHEGRIRVQRGPGARALYLIEKHRPLRYTRSQRRMAYKRTFNYGEVTPPAGAVVNTTFHRQFVALMSAIAQYYRDLLIGEVIRGSTSINERPFGSQATIQRLGSDLRYALDRCTYGSTMPLTLETSQYLAMILDALETPDIRKAFDANNKWDVVETVSRRHLGGVAELAQRSKMADAGRQVITWVADNTFKGRDAQQFRAEIAPLGPLAEEWIAAYRMTREGQSFRGVTDTIQRALGIRTAGRAA